jgi:hypothetical protein
MTKDPIAKMYKHLTAQELALLAFASLANRNELEQARIYDAVPRRTYSCLDAGFTQHLDRVFNMACFWAIQYWQCQTRIMAARTLWLTAKGEQHWQADEALYRHQRRQAAIEAALTEICQEHGIDIEAVKQIAGITSDLADNADPDPDYLAQVKRDMLGVLTS